MMKRLSSLVLFFVIALPAVRGISLAQVSRGTFALINARIETVTHGTVATGTVVIVDGRIADVGTDVVLPGGAEVIDCSGLTVYPGMIDCGTYVGLIEIGSIPETHDEDEIGEITPQMQALTAVNPNSVAIAVTRTNGVTTVLTSPTGGLFPGSAALVNLVGYTPEQMYAGAKFVVLNFPATSRRRSRGSNVRNSDSIARVARARLDLVWEQAVLAARIDSVAGHRWPGDLHPEIDALIPVVCREQPLLIEVNGALDIDSAIAWVRRTGVRAIFTGVAEGWRVANHIADAGIPCIVGPVLTMPSRASDRYDKPYANAGLLKRAGVRVALRSSESANARNLPFHAGYAAAYGLGREEALRSVTIVAAQIFGVDNEIGSIEIGKRATLFAADGDPFEPAAVVRELFIDGYHIPVTNRQVDLYHEFLDRSPGLTR